MSMSITTPVPTRGSRYRRGLTAAVAIAVVALATACSGSAASTGGSAAPATTAADSPTTAAAVTTPAATTPAGTTAVTVTMTEFKFAMDNSALQAGSYTLHAVNAGQYPHALELSGPGVSDQKTAVVQPGQSADLAVTLQAGSYDIWCPVDGHRAKGMEVHVDVAA
jgi:uncharacterized cupredoxin-like copper-binding protein